MTDFRPLPVLLAGGTLDRLSMKQWLGSVLCGEVSDCEVAAVLTALSMRGESEEELAGALDSLRDHMTPFPLPERFQKPAFDTCGTGGDGSDSFNISTTVAFVLAAGGVPVVKHGNRAVSSRSGSADVLESLGIRIDLSPERSLEILEKLGIAFLWAPLYHPALKLLAPLRRGLGIRTLFNLVAPLASPGLVRKQILGVSSLHLVSKLAGVLDRVGHEAFCVIHGDGLDEATLSGRTRVIRCVRGDRIERDLLPNDFGLPEVPLGRIKGGSAQENADILRSVLKGTPGPFLDVTLANAALGFWVAELARTPREGVSMAREVIHSEKSLEILDQWVELSQTIPS
ncbi:MAG: anthranilate phosphoribosyltransferase [Leptospirales bacterium]